jgi:hypothetical protein
LADWLGTRTVHCTERSRDQYERVVALCRVGGEDVSAWLVDQAWALAFRHYSLDYVAHEDRSRAAKRGISASEFQAPWDWRHEQRQRGQEAQWQGAQQPGTQQPGNCVIKGNISRRGERIYHVPGGEYYSRTGINKSKGERWFCSEAEARAAGWRRSLR